MKTNISTLHMWQW